MIHRQCRPPWAVTLLTVFTTLLATGLAAAAEPADEAPWGPENDGLRCRLILGSEYCLGQQLNATVEIKNVSDRERLILSIFNCRAKDHACFRFTGPDGKELKQGVGAGYSKTFGPRSFVALKPGETKRIEYADLAKLFNYRIDNQFHTGINVPGKYTVRFSYFSRKPEKAQTGAKSENGVVTPIFEEPTPEQVAAAWAGELAANPVELTLSPVSKDDLKAHEWGVFTVCGDSRYANADCKAEWSTLPEVFYRQFPKQRLRWVPGAWNKPIVYLHSPRAGLEVKVQVEFSEGVPVVWWPSCESPVNNGGGYGGKDQVQPGGPFRSLTWAVVLGAEILTDREGPGGRSLARGAGGDQVATVAAKEFDLPDSCWLKLARAVPEAALLTTMGTNLTGGAPWTAGQVETERFLYYDGLAPVPDCLRCMEVKDDAVLLRNAASFPLKHLFVVDRRRGPDAPVRFAHAAELAGMAKLRPAFREVPAAEWPAAGVTEVLAALNETGLLASEAKALVEIWKDGFFRVPGVTAFYLLPRAEYDRMLPLTVTPAPGEIIRVGIARHPHIDTEPVLAKRAQELIAQLDTPDEKARAQASQALAEMGGGAFIHLRAAAKNSPSEAVRKRCQELIDNFDATAWLKDAVKDDPGLTAF